ncbi:iron-siderophore ABC transporter substrate-binding protein [Starkeya sp. ORNL1]|uniref:iron-siderophore ABC transporter substrate-binding protein n=1 Tax=Starkeya sp. ORNL1 TaxID=2709380 RepID=UPI001462D477|nr:iron-siderophore ABC transporter substrate-binding protein [Starkeya sp. ORNL1]QJP16906.1 iron-siderophore ABC transporter substrate-binding protein [Starkeya sp. ORNL1]
MREHGPLLNRRQALAAGAALLAGTAWPKGAVSAAATCPATLDWAILETLLAIGAPPVAATELVQFRDVAVEPAVPLSVTDLGLRGLPNFETLLLARPDIIFNSNFYASSEPLLARIAPVESLSIYVPGKPPFDAAVEMTRAIGARLGRAEAEDFITRTSDDMATLSARLGGRPRAVLPINLGDARHFRTFGADSMFGAALEQLGLVNAWKAPTSYSATAPVGLEALAGYDDAWIALIGPTPREVGPVLARSAFWNALPAVRSGRVLDLGPVNPFGALPAMARFARLLVEALVAKGRGLG